MFKKFKNKVIKATEKVENTLSKTKSEIIKIKPAVEKLNHEVNHNIKKISNNFDKLRSNFKEAFEKDFYCEDNVIQENDKKDLDAFDEKVHDKEFEKENLTEKEVKKKNIEDNKKEKNDLNNVDERDLCVICLDAKISFAAIPCGHFNYCQYCADNVIMKQKVCSICRGAVIGTLKIFN